MPQPFWQIYIQHLHPSLKSINYSPLTGRKATTVVREQEKEGKRQKRQILLIKDEENGVESDNMQRDETMCVLDVGMKKKEERNQRLQPAVGSGARELDHLCCGSVSIFAPSRNPGP